MTSGVICMEFVSVMVARPATIPTVEKDFRGARVIVLQEGERQFETWLRLEDGTAVHAQPEHTPLQRILTED